MAVETRTYSVICRTCGRTNDLRVRKDSDGFPFDAVAPARLRHRERDVLAQRDCDCGSEVTIQFSI